AYCTRDDPEIASKVEGAIAIAAGWRWLINYQLSQLVVLHDSLLPKYRGFNPLVTALLARDKEIGVTAILANKDFDCGDIVDSKAISVTYPIKISDAIGNVSKLYFDLTQSLLRKI